jgi:hypothetical protein
MQYGEYINTNLAKSKIQINKELKKFIERPKNYNYTDDSSITLEMLIYQNQ